MMLMLVSCPTGEGPDLPGEPSECAGDGEHAVQLGADPSGQLPAPF